MNVRDSYLEKSCKGGGGQSNGKSHDLRAPSAVSVFSVGRKTGKRHKEARNGASPEKAVAHLELIDHGHPRPQVTLRGILEGKLRVAEPGVVDELQPPVQLHDLGAQAAPRRTQAVPVPRRRAGRQPVGSAPLGEPRALRRRPRLLYTALRITELDLNRSSHSSVYSRASRKSLGQRLEKGVRDGRMFFWKIASTASATSLVATPFPYLRTPARTIASRNSKRMRACSSFT